MRTSTDRARLLTRYVSGPGMVNGAVVDELLARTSSGGTTAWYLTDKLDSVRDVVSSAGSVLDHVVYDSFGNITTETSASNGDRFKFAGTEHDSVIDQDYDYARNYKPTMGRFTATDPLGFNAGDDNLYRYVHNRVLNAIDPSGTTDSYYDPASGNINQPFVGIGQWSMNGQSGAFAGDMPGGTMSPVNFMATDNRPPRPVWAEQGDDPEATGDDSALTNELEDQDTQEQEDPPNFGTFWPTWLGYFDINIGAGIGLGVQVGPSNYGPGYFPGFHIYVGGQGPGASVSWAPYQTPSPGLNLGVGGEFGIGGQVGCSWNPFQSWRPGVYGEVGLGAGLNGEGIWVVSGDVNPLNFAVWTARWISGLPTDTNPPPPPDHSPVSVGANAAPDDAGHVPCVRKQHAPRVRRRLAAVSARPFHPTNAWLLANCRYQSVPPSDA